MTLKLKANNLALFANTINEIGKDAHLFSTECERFGMTWGCRVECPVFQRGKCRIEDVDAFKGMIKDVCEDEYEDIVKMYPQLDERKK